MSLILSNDSRTVELSKHYMPNQGISWGGKVRKRVTKYAGKAVTVQVLGVDIEPISLTGKLRDSEGGKGFAVSKMAEMTLLMEDVKTVKLEYETHQIWGVFDIRFKEKYRGYIEYEISFQGLWDEDPVKLPFPELAPETEQTFGDISNDSVQVSGWIDVNPPVFLNGSEDSSNWYKDLLLDVAGYANSINALIATVDGVASFGEMTLAQIDQVQKSAILAMRYLGNAIDRNKNLVISAISKPGVFVSSTSAFQIEFDTRAINSRANLLEMIRRTEFQKRPKTSNVYMVKDGDTLQSIANRKLGDFSRWEEIADVNDLVVGELTTGQILVLPKNE